MTDMAYSKNERSISTFISMGWIPVPAAHLAVVPCDLREHYVSHLDVQEPYFAGVIDDELLALLDVVAHQNAARLVSNGRLLDLHLQERPLPRS